MTIDKTPSTPLTDTNPNPTEQLGVQATQKDLGTIGLGGVGVDGPVNEAVSSRSNRESRPLRVVWEDGVPFDEFSARRLTQSQNDMRNREQSRLQTNLIAVQKISKPGPEA